MSGVRSVGSRFVRDRLNGTPPSSSVLDAPLDYVKAILTSRVYDVARETPLEHARKVSASLRNNVLLKREDLQDVFSFKIRGAYNRIANLTEDEKARGIIACSAGNHAQGVALSAARLGLRCTIVMPSGTPSIKVDAVRMYANSAIRDRQHSNHPGNVDVVLAGDTFQEAEKHAIQLAQQRHSTMVHPYDDPSVIAGQGTVGLEIVKQTISRSLPLDAIFVPVGGGGLAAGIASYVKRVTPDVKVIGVEAEDSASMTQSLQEGYRVLLEHVGVFADGTAVKQVGEETFRLCNELLDDMVNVNTDEICAAMRDHFNETRSIVEPSGALALAGLKQYVHDTHVRDQTLVAISSGANMDFTSLRYVAERSELEEAMLAVTIPEGPGSFHSLYSAICPRDVTAFSYRFGDSDRAQICLSFRTSGSEDTLGVIQTLENEGMDTLDLSHNEMAKVHGRFLVGGRAPKIENEQVYRFEFPERAGALGRFLDRLNAGWNVTLFHYRYAGGDIGRVLVGLQINPENEPAFQSFLNDLGYEFTQETCNDVYDRFLR